VGASEDVGLLLGIISVKRQLAGGILFLLILAAALLIHSPRFEWWQTVTLVWWTLASTQLWAGALSVAFIGGSAREFFSPWWTSLQSR
jgi:hypothetical protein